MLDGPPPPARAEKLVSFDKTREFVVDMLETVTEAANDREYLGPLPVNPEQIPDLWLTEPDDRTALSTPVARIIHRRLPTGTDELGNPDLGDFIEALIAVWFYSRRQFSKLREWRRAKRALNITDQPPGEGQPDAA